MVGLGLERINGNVTMKKLVLVYAEPLLSELASLIQIPPYGGI